jgi:hypothetical protein
MSNQNQVELGRGPVLHEVEYWRLMKAAWAAARLGANEAVFMVSSSGARCSKPLRTKAPPRDPISLNKLMSLRVRGC